MDDDLLTLLHTSPIFSSLPNRVCKKLIPKFEKVELHQDEVLYYQGDPSDSLEILLSGKLVAILTTASGENKIAGYVDPGETVGEMGSLSGEPRTTTVKAVKNSVLFKLPNSIFLELCREYPAVLFAIINPIVSRSHRVIELISSEKYKKHIALIPANETVSLGEFYEKFTEQVNELSSVILLSDYTNELKDATPEQIHAIINNAKAQNPKKIKHKILYLVKPTETPLAQFCFDKIDMIYVVTNDTSPPLLSPFVIEKIHHFQAISKNKPELILVHDKETLLPHHTSRWLQLADFGMHHHIRINELKDFRRLLRFIRNKAVGLVLSGGGTRGWGHIGAIRALLEAGIPIDAIGGTSVGAIIAGCYAMTESYDDTLAQFQEIIERSRYSVSFINLTWPAISLFNAKGLTTVLQKVFGEVHIEDLWLPYFCVSSNLARNSEDIHRHGLLWEKIRGSVSIPGVIPPMLLNGELHFDGGLLNNLPIDVMRKLVSHRGNVIAVELGGSNKDEHKYYFPPILTFWQTLLAKLGFVDYKFPRFTDTFLKSLLVGSTLKAQQNSVSANILISLDLAHYPMLHSNKKVESKIIDIGYETTIRQIKNMQKR